jgi:hypothetical protein
MISPLASSKAPAIRALSSLVAGCLLAISAIAIVVIG